MAAAACSPVGEAEPGSMSMPPAEVAGGLSSRLGRCGWRIKKLVPKAAPNNYRKPSQDHTGYDPEYVWLEKCCSLCAMILTVIAIIAALIYYCVEPVNVSEQLKNYPNYQTFSSRLAYQRPWLLSFECPCTQKAIPLALEEGGFIGRIDYGQDTMCSGMQTPAPTDSHTYNADLKAHVCQTSSVDAMNVGISSSAGSPYLECAAMDKMFELFMNDMKKMCLTADAVSRVALKSFKNGHQTVQGMDTMEMLQKQIRTDLDALGLQVGVTMRAAAMSSPFAGAVLHPPDDMRRLVQTAGVDGAMYRIGCKTFTVGGGAIFNLTRILEECMVSSQPTPWYTGECTFTDGKIQTYKLPCGKNLMALVSLVKGTEYHSLADGMEHGFLKGMSDEVRDKRNKILLESRSEEEDEAEDEAEDENVDVADNQSRRLQPVLGGFTLTDSAKTMHERFFNICKPRTCSLQMRKKPDFSEAILLLLALIGGISALGKIVGKVLLQVGRKVFKDVKDEGPASSRV